jgi:hypothetical protein
MNTIKELSSLEKGLANEINNLLNYYPTNQNYNDSDSLLCKELATNYLNLKVRHRKIRTLQQLLKGQHHYKSTITTSNSKIVLYYHYNYICNEGIVDFATGEKGVVFEGVSYKERIIDKIKVHYQNSKLGFTLEDEYLLKKIKCHEGEAKDIILKEMQELKEYLELIKMLDDWQCDKEGLNCQKVGQADEICQTHVSTVNRNLKVSDHLLLAFLVNSDNYKQQNKIMNYLKLRHEGVWSEQGLIQAMNEIYDKCLYKCYNQAQWKEKQDEVMALFKHA